MGLLRPTNDFLERLRGLFIPYLGILVATYNESTGSKLYVRGVTTDAQFVGRVSMSEEDFEEILQEMNFQRNPLASIKRLVGTREQEEGSFRWIPSSESNLNDDFQLHVILYDGIVVPDAQTGETFIYGHWEYRWDRYPLRHYKGLDADVSRGVNMMQAKLDEAGIKYDSKLRQ